MLTDLLYGQFIMPRVRRAQEDELKIIQKKNQQVYEYDSKHDPDLKINQLLSSRNSYYKKRVYGEYGHCFVYEDARITKNVLAENID